MEVSIQRHGNIWRDGLLHQNTPAAAAKLRLLRITGVGDRVKSPVRFWPVEPAFSAEVVDVCFWPKAVLTTATRDFHITVSADYEWARKRPLAALSIMKGV